MCRDDLIAMMMAIEYLLIVFEMTKVCSFVKKMADSRECLDHSRCRLAVSYASLQLTLHF
jgi:hypothetical protein